MNTWMAVLKNVHQDIQNNKLHQLVNNAQLLVQHVLIYIRIIVCNVRIDLSLTKMGIVRIHVLLAINKMDTVLVMRTVLMMDVLLVVLVSSVINVCLIMMVNLIVNGFPCFHPCLWLSSYCPLLLLHWFPLLLLHLRRECIWLHISVYFHSHFWNLWLGCVFYLHFWIRINHFWCYLW